MAVSATSIATVLKLSANVVELAKGLDKAGSLLKSFGDGVKRVMEAAVQYAEKGVQALKKLGRQIQMLSGQSAKLDSMRDSFNKMAAEAGATGQELLAAMNEASLGMVKDADLIQSSMTAMMLINKKALGDVTETIPMLSKIATSAARALGEDVGFMFDSLARGIGRASPMILDNLGFTIRLSEVYGDYAEKLGKTTKELTILERQTALLNTVMAQGEGYVEKLGISTGGLATNTKQLHKIMQDLNDTIGQAFMPLVQAIQSAMNSLATAVVSKVIPAFRTLGRVFSEVFGTKNPFMRWVEGKPIEQTEARIASLVDNLKTMKEIGPDFMGGITAAMDEFDAGVAELNEKFGPQFAEANAEIAERVQDVWDDYNLRQKREDEDAKRDELRRTEDHYERLEEIENRYTQDISDAIRKRDARALMNLLRKQEEERSAAEDDFKEGQERDAEDRAIRRQRAKEDAELRVADIQASGAKRLASIQAQYDKEYAVLVEAKDKATQAAKEAWEAETAYLEEEIEKQKALMMKQVAEQWEAWQEMQQPLSPFFQKLKEILIWVWDKLQIINDLVMKVIQDPDQFISKLKDRLGPALASVSGFLDRLNEVWTDLKERFGPDIIRTWEQIKTVFETVMNEQLASAWEDLKRALEELKPVLPIILDLLELLLPFLGVALVTAITIAIASIRGFIAALKGISHIAVELLENLRTTWEGIKDMIFGALRWVLGVLTLNYQMIGKGMAQFFKGLIGVVKGNLETVWDIATGIGATILLGLEGFIESILQTIGGLFDSLVGHSIIPDGLRMITDAFGTFFIELGGKWREGWEGLVTVLKEIWGTITGFLDTVFTGVGEKVGGWFSGIKETVSNVINPARDAGTSPVPVLSGGGSSQYNFNANGWNLYGGNSRWQPRSTVEDVMEEVLGEATSTFDAWRRR